MLAAPPIPLLLVLALLVPPTLATGDASAVPVLDPLRRGFDLPLYRHAQLSRRSSAEAMRSWALRESSKVNGRYGGREPVREREKRATTALSVAGYGTASASGSATASSSARSATATSPVGLVKVMNYEADLEYFAPVGFGAPPQYMNVILDTGSADLWIASSNCTSATGCASIPVLNGTVSTSAIDVQTTFNVRYGSGSASGEIWKDYIGFAGYNVSNQSFALCDTVSTDLLNGNISGLMGLGFQSLAASGVTPFWQNLWQAGVLPFPGFAFYLTRFVNVSSAATVEPGGVLTFGYLNDSLYDGEINYVAIPEGLESYWVVPMDNVAVNGTNVTGVDVPMVAIDTGTTLIGGPSTVIKALYSAIPGAQAATGAYTGYYSYPCASVVNVTMSFGGIAYNMSSADFNLGPFGIDATTNVSTCLGAFFDLTLSSTSKISWVIGAAFLKNVFSVFRASPASVGFAALSYGNRTYNGSLVYNVTDSSGRNETLTQLPNGIYGPSGVTSLRTTVAANTITTAIQAGQTASRSPISAAASRVGRSAVGFEWAGVGVGLLLGVGVLL